MNNDYKKAINFLFTTTISSAIGVSIFMFLTRKQRKEQQLLIEEMRKSSIDISNAMGKLNEAVRIENAKVINDSHS